MIFFIIALIVTIGSYIGYDICEPKMESDRKNWEKWCDRSAAFLILFVVSAAIFISMIIGIIVVHTYAGKQDKIELKNERAAIVLAIGNPNDYTTISNQLYKDVAKYNTKVIKAKHWANSPWTNWFYYDDYSDIETIDIENLTKAYSKEEVK